MSVTLFACAGGHLALPDRSALLLSRADGGNLVIYPPRIVWERSELTRDELALWGALVASAGWAMLDALPQLAGGCINYWEAGNWALNDEAEPRGPKIARDARRMHLHLLGRSPTSSDPHWRWGESPRFPAFAERHTWAARFERLTPEECVAIVTRTESRVREYYRMASDAIESWSTCPTCGYPHAPSGGVCAECAR
jgi:hypothetical protein